MAMTDDLMKDFEYLDLVEYFEYLDELRESGETNMLSARPYLVREFRQLDSKEAGEVLTAWMKTFAHDIPAEDRAEIAKYGEAS